MFAQGTYNAVRTSQRLRDLGFSETEVVMNSIFDFFGAYKKENDSKYNVSELEYSFHNKIICDLQKTVLKKVMVFHLE